MFTQQHINVGDTRQHGHIGVAIGRIVREFIAYFPTPAADLDFAHDGPGGNVSVVLPADLHADAHDALRSLELGFFPALEQAPMANKELVVRFKEAVGLG